MIEKFGKYEKYKDSGNYVLEKIPKHWITLNGQFIFKVINERSKTGQEELLSVSEKRGVIPRKNANVTMFMAESYKGYKLCEPGDLVINSLWAWSGGLGFSEFNGIISTAYSVYRPNHQKFDYSFLHYLSRTRLYIDQFRLKSKGIWISRLLLNDWAFLRIPFSFPPKAEQTQIANFLDTKTQAIDNYIALKEQTIALLEERKAAVINEAVTKGLDNSVEMKDSGVEWLGEIPKEWEATRLRYVVSKLGSGVTPSGGATSYLEKGIPLLRSQNIHFNKIELKGVAFIGQKTHDKMKGSKVLKNDVLLNITGGSLGRCYFVTNEFTEANVNQHVCIIRPSKINTKFLYFLLSSKIGQDQIWYYQYGGGREGLNLQSIKNFFLPLPKEKQQLEIVTFLEEKTDLIYQEIENNKTQIRLIKEYRESLISAAVTGKIDVRSEVI